MNLYVKMDLGRKYRKNRIQPILFGDHDQREQEVDPKQIQTANILSDKES